MYNMCEALGRVKVKAGNTTGTNSAPPLVPPQTLRQQAQRLSRFSGRASRSGRQDADVVVDVGGNVGGMLKVTCRGPPPAVTAAMHGQVAPAQRGDPCAVAWLVLCLSVSWLLSGGVSRPCRSSRPSLGGRNVLSAPAQHLVRSIVDWGQRRLRTVRRTSIKRASSKSSGSVDGAGAQSVVAGGRPAMVVCRSLRKDGNGDSAVLTN
jgi:hypothetical protein